MSRVDKMRTSTCTKADARSRLKQAEAHVLVAQICLDDEGDVATPGVAAALAVLAVIAAADAACCHRLGLRSRAQDHSQAETLISTIEPHGKAMARKFRAVATAKDDSHYSLTLVSSAKASSMITKAQDLVTWASEILRT